MSNETKIQQLREQINTIKDFAKSMTIKSADDWKIYHSYLQMVMDKGIELIALGGKL